MKNKVINFSLIFIAICYFCFSVYWTCISAYYNFSRFGLYVGVIILVLFLSFILFKKREMFKDIKKKRLKDVKICKGIKTFEGIKIFRNLKVNRSVFIIVFSGLALILRLVLLNLSFNKPVSDYATFYYNAIYVATGEGMLSSRYISAFPYLYSYIFLLGQFMKLFGTSYVNVVLLNIIIDLLGAVFIYLFARRINKGSAIYAFYLWLFNPFNIYFSVVCSPVVVVNTLIAVVLYVSSLFLENLGCIKKIIIYGLLLGICLGVANAFRPIMIIFIIAMFLYLLFLILSDDSIKRVNLVIGFLIVFGIYQVGNQAYFRLVSNVSGYDISKSMSGWSIYVGSNYDSYGEWSTLNVETYNKYYNDDDYTPFRFNDAMMRMGIERYKSNGVKKNLILLINKSSILAARANDYNYGSFVSSVANEDAFLGNFVHRFTNLFWYLIIVLNFIFAVIFVRLKKKNSKELILCCLFVIGFCVASLIVEVSPRYFYPIFPFLVLVSAVSLNWITQIFLEGELKI